MRTSSNSRNSYKDKRIKSGTTRQFISVDDYIRTFPEDVQIILEKIRQTIQEAAPEAEEAISYGIPTFKLNGKNLVHFAGWKNHIGFYPTPSGTKAFRKELARYKAGKGSLKFPLDRTIPFDLIKRIVIFRAKDSSQFLKATHAKRKDKGRGNSDTNRRME